MWIYFLAIRIAALFGHRKARLLVKGQKETMMSLKSQVSNMKAPIWFHAASVGEFEQARPLIERLRREQPNRKIVLTFFSPSGYEMRKNYDQVDKVLYLPFATRRNARLFLDALQPKMAIFVKYEFWPAYLHELKKRKIRTYNISAIFRPGQLFFLPWASSGCPPGPGTSRQCRRKRRWPRLRRRQRQPLSLSASAGFSSCVPETVSASSRNAPIGRLTSL